MVGFGSSLRMSHRAGWEAAYLDYETLKLQLSQIESVYEEEGHRTRANSRDVFGENSDDQNGHRRSNARRDYRDELFLESDSDAAFASVNSGADASSDTLSGIEAQRPDARVHVPRFAMVGSFSSDESASLDDDMERCVPWRTPSKAVGKSKRSKQRYQQQGDYFVPTTRDSTGPTSFFVSEDSETFDPSSKMSASLFNAPLQYNNFEESTESTALLGFTGASRNNDFFGTSTAFIGDKTPPRQNFAANSAHIYGITNSQVKATPKRANLTQQERLEEERRKARKIRRKRVLARQRRARDKKVPPHIRIAHSKARSITERFLGLLRAEVEKVTLFTQARLGELADTAGSLRFLSSDELTQLSQSFVANATSAAYDHPLSDGGIHPSASSSSDEGAARQWDSDSDSNGDQSNHSQFSISQPFVGGMASPTMSARATTLSIGGIRSAATRRREQEEEDYEAAKKNIEHFQHLRRERPIFQRNDHIVGEDLLLISAVDEADAYSAVGVELLHILKYICVNVIAVRKICRKHDRLLQNRMLGGYYHRKRNTRAQEERTLGGLIAHVAGDIYEAHPALIGLVNHGKLMGVYDLKIQQLANSRTVKVISSCLALALSEYEVSRTRADALATLTKADHEGHVTDSQKNDSSPSRLVSFDFKNPTHWVKNTQERFTSPCRATDMDSVISDDHESGPPSTASSVSLTRLQFTVLSVAALREASRIKSSYFATYLSRGSLGFTGHPVVGEGLDGCSRETLDFLVYYSPDAALLLDSNTLYEGLRYGRWRNMSIASVLRSSLAVALGGDKLFHEQEQIVLNSLSILPKSEGLDSSAPLEGRGLPIATSFSISRFADISAGLLRCNRHSLFLYTMNYYIVHPTANTFTEASGVNNAYSAAIIGAASFSAILAALFHCSILIGHTDSTQMESNTSLYKGVLIFSALCGISGNAVHALGISKLSVSVAVLGRFLIGFGAADIVHRQFVVSALHPSLVVAESARLVHFKTAGLLMGLIIGSLVELAPYKSIRYGVQLLQLPNWIMGCFWLIHACRLILSTRDSKSPKGSACENVRSVTVEAIEGIAQEPSSDSSSDSDPSPGGPVRLFHQPPGMRDEADTVVSRIKSLRGSNRKLEIVAPRRSRKQWARALIKRVRRLLAYNIAVPVMLGLAVYTTFAQEVLFSSCAIIVDRYFGWSGNIAGIILVCLSFTILPIDFVCEQIARRYEERTTIKRSMLLLGFGLLVMVNWGSVFALVVNLNLLFTETQNMSYHYYDWLLGIPQYVIGFLLSFIGLHALHGASRSLLSKIVPSNPRRNSATNLGAVVTLVGLFAQFIANFQIVAVSLSHRLINTDIVNSLVMPLLVGCLVAYFFVRKHFFFLM